MDIETYINLDASQIARVVELANIVVALPLNGARRWFILDRSLDRGIKGDDTWVYIQALIEQIIRLARLLFEHGIETVLMPVFGSALLDERGRGYQPGSMDGKVELQSEVGKGSTFIVTLPIVQK